MFCEALIHERRGNVTRGIARALGQSFGLGRYGDRRRRTRVRVLAFDSDVGNLCCRLLHDFGRALQAANRCALGLADTTTFHDISERHGKRARNPPADLLPALRIYAGQLWGLACPIGGERYIRNGASR